jgi:dipeptidyl-peptidase 4
MLSRRCRLARVGALLVAICCVTSAAAQQRLLTIDDLYDPAKRLDVGSREYGPAAVVKWLNDAEYLWPREAASQPRRFTIVKVNAATGSEVPLFDPATLEAALARLPGMTSSDAARLARQRTYPMPPAHDALIVTIADDLFYWALSGDHLVRITSAPGLEENPAFSPDGRSIAYTRAGNLYVADLEGHERALTTDGSTQRLNGRLDWIYQEEIYGRGTYRAFWWSPDSSRLAFLQLDETPVPRFAVVDHLPYGQEVELTEYPRPGDPNPKVKLGIVRALDGSTTWMDTEKYGAADFLMVRVSWTSDSRQVVAQVQNREQTWLDLDFVDVSSGSVTTLLCETTPAWVSDNGDPEWLPDGTFLWLSERTGWNHVYHYTRDGTLVKQITDGKWEVRSLYGTDRDRRWLYFAATERSPIGVDIYRVSLDGGTPVRLSGPLGTHAAFFNPSLSAYVDLWSDITTPTQARVHKADGTELRIADRNPVPVLTQFRLSTPELLQVPTRDGSSMEALIIKPRGFNPRRKYPVYQHTYAGPHAPQVRNAWGGTTYLYHQLLAQHGIIVWICDNRTASGNGIQSAWPAYKRLGELELQDIEDGVSWLKKQPWVDSTRIGLNGWSYGGFMTAYALTHSTSFAMGIAGGSVTDWRNYDSIYTERYMLQPQNNPDGYRRTAPRWSAKDLTGRLLLITGAMDDNVHMQNTMQFAYELQKAGKPFELMVYPKSRHGVSDPLLLKHMRQTALDFVLRTLRPAQPVVPAQTAGAADGTPSAH